MGLLYKLSCEATQVKQKFGGLRFYTDVNDDFINGLISMAESISYKICEHCGASGVVRTNSRLISTLCNPCDNKRYK